MMRILVGALAVMVAIAVGCTKDNPAATCTDNNTCVDPNFPFCDVDGSISGHPGSCVAPQCIPNHFGSCADADTALVCNDTGDNYEPMACPFGCDPTSGCISCADGCELGCAADGMHCKQIVPSNNLGMYYDAASPQDITLQSGSVNVDDSTYFDGNNTITLPSFDVGAPPSGAPMRVFVGKHVVLGDVTFETLASLGLGRAVAILATEDLELTGRVVVATGAVDITGCTGSLGTSLTAGITMYRSGTGGGGHATAGAAGGNSGQLAGGAGGAASGSAQLVPLRGGCLGGRTSGGGAIQLVSRTAVVISGTVVTDGTIGFGGRAGGGGGGGILLEAPTVTLNSSAKLLARGGGGAAGNAMAPMPPDDASQPPGGTCSPSGPQCSDGGAGASATVGAGAGIGLAGQAGGTNVAGGGGGGVGVVRINTKDGTVPTLSQAVIAAMLTLGSVSAE